MDDIVSGKFIITSIEIYFVKSNSKEREKANFPSKGDFERSKCLQMLAHLECH